MLLLSLLSQLVVRPPNLLQVLLHILFVTLSVNLAGGQCRRSLNKGELLPELSQLRLQYNLFSKKFVLFVLGKCFPASLALKIVVVLQKFVLGPYLDFKILHKLLSLLERLLELFLFPIAFSTHAGYFIGILWTNKLLEQLLVTESL